jgi:hypothetical protein
MNNEPVAWMYSKIEPDKYGMGSIHYSSTKWGENESVHLYMETPLYTHPADLTDEEIIKVYEDILGVVSARSSAIDFCRAILKKASEK